jgi:UDP-glucose 4-epimerase
MIVLITGGFGFVGSHLAERFIKNKHKVILVTKSFKKKKNVENILKKVKIEKIDITNQKKLETCLEKYKPELIIHLAGETSHSKSFENPLLDIDLNAKSTLIILEKIREMNLKCRFILGSSFIVVGKPKKLPVNEETPCNPTTIYGANRLLSENYCKIYSKVFNLDTIIFRITNSFGPREQVIPNKNAINYLIYKAFRGDDITIYNQGKFFRDLIYISDVINAIEKIVKKGKSGELYWISSGEKSWFYKIGSVLEKLTSSKTKFIETPKYTKKVDVGNFVVNNSKIKLLGWKPKISIEEGMIKTLKYFKDNDVKN